MGKIISLEGYRFEKNKCSSLNDFLNRATLLKKEVKKKEDEGDLILINPRDLEKMFEVKLNDFLFENELISTKYFICAMFIASLLKEAGFSVPESWYAIDYFIKNNETGEPRVLLDGANNCFLLSTLFSERCEKRGMKLSDYVSMGAGLYKSFYSQTGKKVAYHMSSLFEIMSIATRHCVKSLG